MNTARILTQSQAEAIATAMAHLNNVGAFAPKIEIGDFVVLPSKKSSQVIVQRADGQGWPECHGSMSDFDAAYGLQEADKDSEDFVSWSCS